MENIIKPYKFTDQDGNEKILEAIDIQDDIKVIETRDNRVALLNRIWEHQNLNQFDLEVTHEDYDLHELHEDKQANIQYFLDTKGYTQEVTT